ncbi:MAG: phosphatidate cytidylyltransferase [Bacteroidia bacterium]
MNKNLIQRIATALVAGSAVIAAIFFSPYGLWVFASVVAVLSLREFIHLMKVPKGYQRFALIGGILIWLLALAELLAENLSEIPPSVYFVLAILILPFMVIRMLFDKKVSQPVPLLGNIVLGFVYCFLPLILFYKISLPVISSEYDPSLPLGILLLTWVLDSGAYFAGRWLGKHPLFPRISPKKTWEGSIGGAVLCIALGVLLEKMLPAQPYNWIIIAAIISVFSQLGDLIESMFKRSIEIKDSGSLLPGHGGMLDRFDGIYVSIPFLFLYFSLL